MEGQQPLIKAEYGMGKLDFSQLVFRELDRIGWQLSTFSQVSDGNNIIRSSSALFGIKASLLALEGILNAKGLAEQKDYLEKKKKIAEPLRLCEAAAMGSGYFSGKQRLWLDYLMQWYSLMCQQLPKLRLIKSGGKGLESAKGEDDARA